jgi:hypothetical protein
MKVGDTMWQRSTQYKGAAYQQVDIVAETSRSWVVVSTTAAGWERSPHYLNRFGTKLPKSMKGWETGTEHAAKLQAWAHSHYYAIARQVERTYPDADQLLVIAKLIGYDKLPEETTNA